jgi:hypothetical protein
MSRITTLIKFKVAIIALLSNGLCLSMNNNSDNLIINVMQQSINRRDQNAIIVILNHSTGFNWNNIILDQDGNNAFHLMAQRNLTNSISHAINNYVHGMNNNKLNNDGENVSDILLFNAQDGRRNTTFNDRK